jgi:hypothetical protein
VIIEQNEPAQVEGEGVVRGNVERNVHARVRVQIVARVAGLARLGHPGPSELDPRLELAREFGRRARERGDATIDERVFGGRREGEAPRRGQGPFPAPHLGGRRFRDGGRFRNRTSPASGSGQHHDGNDGNGLAKAHRFELLWLYERLAPADFAKRITPFLPPPRARFQPIRKSARPLAS